MASGRKGKVSSVKIEDALLKVPCLDLGGGKLPPALSYQRQLRSANRQWHHRKGEVKGVGLFPSYTSAKDIVRFDNSIDMLR